MYNNKEIEYTYMPTQYIRANTHKQRNTHPHTHIYTYIYTNRNRNRNTDTYTCSKTYTKAKLYTGPNKLRHISTHRHICIEAYK